MQHACAYGAQSDSESSVDRDIDDIVRSDSESAESDLDSIIIAAKTSGCYSIYVVTVTVADVPQRIRAPGARTGPASRRRPGPGV